MKRKWLARHVLTRRSRAYVYVLYRNGRCRIDVYKLDRDGDAAEQLSEAPPLQVVQAFEERRPRLWRKLKESVQAA